MLRDHDYITRIFSGVSHRLCNLEPTVNFRIPVSFHNIRGYDAHLNVHKFGKIPDSEIKVISHNMEKYLQDEWGKNMFFRDTLYFLPASLEQLTASLAKTGRKTFHNFHEVVSLIYPEWDVYIF